MSENPDFNTEFSLNIKHQIKEELKEPITIGYSPAENVVIVSIIIPKKCCNSFYYNT